MDKRTERIVRWTESFSTLPEDYFFEIMRMYLGEIKTPYNKTKLMEQLASFLRGQEAKKNIAALLTHTDVQIISAVKLLPDSTIEDLQDFFNHEYTLSEFYELISSLEERLLIYTWNKDGKQLVDINPMLDDVLEPFLGVDVLICEKVCGNFEEKNFPASPDFLASFISFAANHKDLCKNDLTFKKRALQEMEEVYGKEKKDLLVLLTKAYFNLGFFYSVENTTRVDFDKAQEFAGLSEFEQLIYLAIFAASKLSRSNLAKTASLLLATLKSLPEQGYTYSNICKLTQLLKNQNGGQENFAVSRLSRLFAESAHAEVTDSGIMAMCIENCITLGILYNRGIDENSRNGDKTYALSSYFKNLLSGEKKSSGEKKVVNMDSGFSITLMPGLSFAELLPLMRFLLLKYFDTAALYEINKQTVMAAFDMGLKPENIFKALTQYSCYELPQNIKINVEEWNSTYNSAALYKGYVLKVSKENAALTEKNPQLSPHIREILSPGIYLLDFKDDDDMREVISKCGLDFMGKPKTAEEKIPSQPLPGIRNDVRAKESVLSTKSVSNSEEQEKILSQMTEYLDGKEMNEEQLSGLKERIARRIVVDKVQLRAESVHYDVLEASGTDYSAMLHVIESAISTDSMIEMETTEAEGKILGFPSNLNKKSVNGEFTLRMDRGETVKLFHASSIIRVKKLRSWITLNPYRTR